MMKASFFRVPLWLLLLAAFPMAWAGEPVNVPMTAAHWRADGDTAFLTHEGFPDGILDVKSGSAVLRGANFHNGTIAFDMEIDPNASGIPSIEFHRRDAASAEEFYLRPGPDCPPSDDCVQYAPVTHGVMLWDFYPEYQASAPVRETGWNHVRLVISGRRMDVYINHQLAPCLRVGELEADTSAGGVSLQGQALFANLVLTPGAVDGIPPYPAPDPSAKDPGLIRHWQVSPPYRLSANHKVAIADMPSSAHVWKPIAAERGGAINLSRRYGSPAPVPAASVVWLKTTIDSSRKQDEQVAIGWLRAVWVFANGKPVFAGENYYYPPAARRVPDGRLSLQNGTFRLPLKKGANQIAVALSNKFPQGHAHYGWGLILKLHSPGRLKLGAGH